MLYEVITRTVSEPSQTVPSDRSSNLRRGAFVLGPGNLHAASGGGAPGGAVGISKRLDSSDVCGSRGRGLDQGIV